MHININNSMKMNYLESKLVNTIHDIKKEIKYESYAFTSKHISISH